MASGWFTASDSRRRGGLAVGVKIGPGMIMVAALRQQQFRRSWLRTVA